MPGPSDTTLGGVWAIMLRIASSCPGAAIEFRTDERACRRRLTRWRTWTEPAVTASMPVAILARRIALLIFAALYPVLAFGLDQTYEGMLLPDNRDPPIPIVVELREVGSLLTGRVTTSPPLRGDAPDRVRRQRVRQLQRQRRAEQDGKVASQGTVRANDFPRAPTRSTTPSGEPNPPAGSASPTRRPKQSNPTARLAPLLRRAPWLPA